MTRQAITSEAQFMARVRRDAQAMYPGLVWTRFVDRFSSGIPDVGLAYRGHFSWLEFKFLRAWPRRPRPLVTRDLVTPLQARFLLSQARAGIRAYAYVGFITPSGALAAFEVLAEDLHTETIGGPQPITWRRDADTWLKGLIGPK
jgi:hypothetical protein